MAPFKRNTIDFERVSLYDIVEKIKSEKKEAFIFAGESYDKDF